MTFDKAKQHCSGLLFVIKRRLRMFDVLKSLKCSNPFSSLSAPVSWQAASSVVILCSMDSQCCEFSLSASMPWSSNSAWIFWNFLINSWNLWKFINIFKFIILFKFASAESREFESRSHNEKWLIEHSIVEVKPRKTKKT